MSEIEFYKEKIKSANLRKQLKILSSQVESLKNTHSLAMAQKDRENDELKKQIQFFKHILGVLAIDREAKLKVTEDRVIGGLATRLPINKGTELLLTDAMRQTLRQICIEEGVW